MHHFVFIEAPIDIVAGIALHWPDAPWWPQKCKLIYRVKNKTEGYLGSRIIIKVRKILGMKWLAEVTRYTPNRLVEHTFKWGMFRGSEVVSLEERYNGTRLDYVISYAIRGPLNNILWPIRFQKDHVASIKSILDGIHDQSLKAYRQKQDKEFEKE